MDPAELEGIDGEPVDLERVLNHILAIHPCTTEEPLNGTEILHWTTKYLTDDVFKDLSSEFKAEVIAFMKSYSEKVNKVQFVYVNAFYILILTIK